MSHADDEWEFAIFGAAEPANVRFDMPYDEFADGPLPENEFADGPLPDNDFADGPLPGNDVPHDALPEAYAVRLNWFLDEVSHEDAWLAKRAARRARAVEQARAWAMLSDEFVLPDPHMSESDRESWVMRVFVSEVATRLRLPEPTAGRLVEESRVLVQELPSTLDALSAARISYQHARVVIEQAKTLPAAVRAAFEQGMLPDAARLPVTQFRRRAVRARERMHPESIEDRTRSAVAERRFALEPDIDGMAWLHHHLPATQAHAVFSRVTDIATSLQGDGEQRTLAQLRSDVAADLLLDGMPAGSQDAVDAPPGVDRGGETTAAPNATSDKVKRAWGIRPTVLVTVPVLTLLGKSDEPALLDGYGPIDADTARQLAGRATSFIRLLTHPETGVVLSVGKERYKVPKDLRTWLEIRDETCRFPGCGRAASRTDADHTLDWAKGGATDAGNLACVCEPHHRMKHVTRWQVVQRGNGVLDWRSPTGRVHTTRPAVELQRTSLPKASGRPPRTDSQPPPF